MTTEQTVDAAHLPDGSRLTICVKTAQYPDDEDVNHSHAWWFRPNRGGPENSQLEVSAYLHKTWTETSAPTSFTEEDGETIVEAKRHLNGDIPMSEVPDVVLERLRHYFGYELVERSVQRET